MALATCHVRGETRIVPVSPHGLFCATTCGSTVYIGLMWCLAYSIFVATRLSVTLGGFGGPKSARVLSAVSYFGPSDGGRATISLLITRINILLREDRKTFSRRTAVAIHTSISPRGLNAIPHYSSTST